MDKKKRVIFILVFFFIGVGVIGYLTGIDWKYIITALACIFALAGISGVKRRSDGAAIRDADKQAVDAERASREATRSMDSVSGRGDEIRREGESLVNRGAKLVDNSEDIIAELRKQDAGAD